MASPVDLAPIIVVQLHLGVDQLGPGSEASTARAFAEVPTLRHDAHILDLGCGTGRQTLTLAGLAPGATIRAVDLLPPFLEHAQRRVDATSFGERIRFEAKSMLDASLGDPVADLIWCEGAIYNVGVLEGLSAWREFLRPEGCVAFTEASWLVPDPPERARAMWVDDYPQMKSVEENLQLIESAGYAPLAHFTLPTSDWKAYYDNLSDNHAALHEKYAGDADAIAELDLYLDHQDVYRECSDSYGYEFYIAQLQ